jgi:hypothetical protein
MQLPSNIEDLFTQTYNGFKAIKLRSASEAIMVENALQRAEKSYQTKITRSKKHGREFIVLLVSPSEELAHAA